jgi:thiosulfate reductase cytochrome b subunit
MTSPVKDTVKHSLWIRWTHWINFPVLSLMVWSGILIYWANDVYKPFFPQKVYDVFHLDHRLALGMAIHFTLMWFLILNGITYVLYLLISGEWRTITPKPRDFRDALFVTLHDLKLIKNAPAQGKFNAAQKIAYSSITVITFALVLTGLAIYKPIQLNWLTSLLGGYETARLIHFILMLGTVAFFIVHVLQVARTGFGNFSSMIAGFEVTSKTWPRAWFSFLTAVVFVIFSFGVWSWANHEPEAANGIPPAFRSTLELNGKIWEAYLKPARAAPTPPAIRKGKSPRVNGDIGLQDDLVVADWRLHIIPEVDLHDQAPAKELVLGMMDLEKLPRTESRSTFKCIEGWSDDISYAGVRFTDFMDTFHLGRKPDGSYYQYVALETPDQEYYVSIDMKSMLQSQVILAYEMNGAALSPQNGAPLRLIIPNKYGIKNLKRIGMIYFSDQRPRDYWAERGYDWFSGL